MHLHIQRNRED
jgi:hypothetical protein